MPRLRPLTLLELSQLLPRVRATLEQLLRAERQSTTKHEPAKTNGRRRAANPALESQIIALVKASKKIGMGSVELAQNTSAPLERVKTIALRLKSKGVFKIIGIKRGAKYVFAGKSA